MTPEKTLRYQNVYHKLSDFENLLRSRGVSPELTETELLPHETKDPSLMNAEQALQALRDLTLDGSIRLMHTLSTDQTLEQLLEQAKAKKSPADPNVPAPAGGIQHLYDQGQQAQDACAPV